ncbi:retrovirus-related pol polyprotein from transposon TNT 1-94 [Tanacetum coccineum]
MAFIDSSIDLITDSAMKSSVCSTPLPPLKKLEGTEPISRPKTIKSILKSKSTLKPEALKGIIINEPSSAPAKGNKSSPSSKVHSAFAGKLKSVKIEDDPSLDIVIKELNTLKLQVSKNQSSYPRILFCKRCERTDHRTCDHAEYMSTINMSRHLKSLGRASSRPNIPRPSKCFFPPCIHYGSIDHLSNECLYYPICKLCGSYDHDTNGHNRIISLEREINPRNPQHAFKRCEACGSSNHTTTDHYDIEWFKRGEALQAKKAEALKSTRAESSNANRSKTPTKSGCSRHMTGVKSYLHKYVEQPGPKVAFIGLKYNLINMSQLCDAKYIVQFDEKKGKIFNSNKEIVMIAPRVSDVYVLDMTSSAQESFFLSKASENLKWLWHKRLAHLNFKTNSCYWISQNFSSPYTPKQNGVAERKNRTLIEAARTMLSGSVFSKQYWTEAVATACYTQNISTIVKRHLKTPYEIFRKRIPNINFLHVFGCLVYIHNHKDHLGKFDEKADDGYLLGYSLVSKAFRVFNTRRQQTKETYHITFDESPKAIKFSKPSVDNINIAESERYPPDEYLYPYEPSQSPHLLVFHQMVTPSSRQMVQEKHIELINIIGNLGADFLSEEEPKKVSKALKHHGWVDAMQDELNQFARKILKPMFDEYFNPPTIVVSPVQEAAAPRAEVLADSPMSTSIDQDAPSTSIPSSQEHEHSPIISQGFEESPKTPTFHDDPLNESVRNYI